MQQLDIFGHPTGAPRDPPRARRNDPVTSKLAAAKVSTFAASHHARILAALEQGNANIYEISKRTGIDHVAVARRMVELQRATPPLATPTEERLDGCRVWAKCR